MIKIRCSSYGDKSGVVIMLNMNRSCHNICILTDIVSAKFFSLSALLRTPPMLNNVGFSPLLVFWSNTQVLKVKTIRVNRQSFPFVQNIFGDILLLIALLRWESKFEYSSSYVLKLFTVATKQYFCLKRMFT